MFADHVGFDVAVVIVVVECVFTRSLQETSILARANARFRPRQVQFTMGTITILQQIHVCIARGQKGGKEKETHLVRTT